MRTFKNCSNSSGAKILRNQTVLFKSSTIKIDYLTKTFLLSLTFELCNTNQGIVDRTSLQVVQSIIPCTNSLLSKSCLLHDITIATMKCDTDKEL